MRHMRQSAVMRNVAGRGGCARFGVFRAIGSGPGEGGQGRADRAAFGTVGTPGRADVEGRPDGDRRHQRAGRHQGAGRGQAASSSSSDAGDSAEKAKNAAQRMLSVRSGPGRRHRRVLSARSRSPSPKSPSARKCRGSRCRTPTRSPPRLQIRVPDLAHRRQAGGGALPAIIELAKTATGAAQPKTSASSWTTPHRR